MLIRNKRSRVRLPRDEYVKLCQKVHERDNYKCRVCGFRGPLTTHHIIFRSQGGDDCSYNLISVHEECHDAIHDRHVNVLCPDYTFPVDGGKLDADKPDGIRIQFVNGYRPTRWRV